MHKCCLYVLTERKNHALDEFKLCDYSNEPGSTGNAEQEADSTVEVTDGETDEEDNNGYRSKCA